MIPVIPVTVLLQKLALRAQWSNVMQKAHEKLEGEKRGGMKDSYQRVKRVIRSFIIMSAMWLRKDD